MADQAPDKVDATAPAAEAPAAPADNVAPAQDETVSKVEPATEVSETAKEENSNEGEALTLCEKSLGRAVASCAHSAPWSSAGLAAFPAFYHASTTFN
jgi:hypothetical protein